MPAIGLSVAVHPPKFSYAARFVQRVATCPPAREALAIFLVFQSTADQELFARGMSLVFPNISKDAYYPVVADFSKLPRVAGSGDQSKSAWKKWYGIAHMMDLGLGGPTYGAMVDAEILPYNRTDCGSSSAWSRLFERLRALEASRRFTAARVDESISYDFGTWKTTGKKYDQGVISGNFDLVKRASGGRCMHPRCTLVQDQIDDALYSWWTDLPYVNLEIAARMLPRVTDDAPLRQEERGGHFPRGPKGHWKALMSNITFSPFEIIAYQQWCVIYEGFRFEDVTNVTKYCKWGSYNEEPYEGSHLAELRPLWVSSTVFVMAEGKKIAPLSADDPPLMIFHVDHVEDRFKANRFRDHWEKRLKER